MLRLHIKFQDPEFPAVCGETLWATPLKNGNYRLENEPVCEDYRYGDIVKAVEVDGMLELQSLVARAL